MDIFQELKQTIENNQMKREESRLNCLKGYDANNFVNSILEDDIPESNIEDLRKNIVNIKEINKDEYTIGVVTTKSSFKDFKNLKDKSEDIPTKTLYRTYIVINKDNDILDNLLYKQFEEENPANNYYNELLDFVKNSNIELIFQKIKDNL